MRVYREHYQLKQKNFLTKSNHALSAASLESSDNLEAIYRY